MSDALRLEKYSFGVGDRFAHQAKAQLRACVKAAERGVEVTPVWNKSFREHSIVGSEPPSVLAAAERAVEAAAPSPVEAALAGIDPDGLSPREALDALYALKKKLEPK